MDRIILRGAVRKAVLEAMRVMVLAAIPVLIDGLSSGLIDWRLVGVTVAVAGLRFLDKLLHEYGKEAGDDRLVKGLTRF